jgi:hypothetical protein
VLRAKNQPVACHEVKSGADEHGKNVDCQVGPIPSRGEKPHDESVSGNRDRAVRKVEARETPGGAALSAAIPPCPPLVPQEVMNDRSFDGERRSHWFWPSIANHQP